MQCLSAAPGSLIRCVRFGAFEVNLQASELRRAGVRVKIDQRSFQILALLLKKEGELVSREELRQHLWSADTVLDFDRNLNKAISKLRSVLGETADKPRFIETLQNRGYRFIATLAYMAQTESAAPVCEGENERTAAVSATTVSGILRNGGGPGVALFGPFDLDLQTLELRKRGALVSIHQQPMQILVLLLKRRGQLVTREEMQESLWPPGTHVDFERSLNKAVFKLREALGDSAEQPLFVETAPGRGYRFVAPVRFAETLQPARIAREAEHVPAGPSREKSPTKSEGQQAVMVPPKSSFVHYAVASFAAIVLVAALLYSHLRLPKVTAGSAQRNTRLAIAVVDLKNLSSDPREAWLSTAFSEWLASDLDSAGQIRIIPSERISEAEIELHTANGDALPSAALGQLGRLTGADYVLSGSYATLGNGPAARIRVDLFLQDPQNGQTTATVSQIGQESELFSLVSRAGSDLRSRIGIRELSREDERQVAAVLPADPEPMRLYAEGLHKLRVFDALGAAQSLQKAVAADPHGADGALAHDALATAWAQLGYDGKATEEAQKAFRLSGNLPRAQRLLVEGHYQELGHRWDRAIQIYRALFEFFPDNIEYGLLLFGAQYNAGQTNDAITTLDRLHQLASAHDDPRIDMAEGRATLALGDMSRALSVLQNAHRKAVAQRDPLVLARTEILEAWVLWNRSEYGKMTPLLQDARHLFSAYGDDAGVAEVVHQEGIVYRQAGDYKRAAQDYQEALDIFRRLGLMKGVAGELLCLADARHEFGDLPGAREQLNQALATYQQINDEDGIALAKTNLGEVAFAMGDHAEAKRLFEESMAIFTKHQDPRKIAMEKIFLGNVARVEGNTDEALSQVQKAIEGFKGVQDTAAALGGQLEMVELMLDTGHIDDAVRIGRETMDDLQKEKEKDVQDVEFAGAFLAQALCRQGKIEDARKVFNDTKGSLDSTHVEATLALAYTDGLIRVSSANADERTAGETILRNVLADANRMQYANYAMEARLELAELQLSDGERRLATSQLRGLIHDAQRKGFGLIAQRASQDLVLKLADKR